MKKIFLFTAALLFSVPAQAVVPDSNEIVFEILRNGKPFGMHSVKFEQDGDKTRVLIDIEMKYKLGPITAFNYEHSNEEVWKGDQILSMTSKTDDDGDDYAVDATWGDKVEVDVTKNAEEEAYEAPKDIYTTSYWNIKSLKADKLLNTQKGEIEDVSLTKIGREEYSTSQETVEADHYKVEASLPLDLWYDAKTQQWIGLKFSARGSDFEYRRLTPIVTAESQ